MAEVEVTAPVNHCRWVMVNNNDGSKRRMKVFDCHSVACRYSVDYSMQSCRCL